MLRVPLVAAGQLNLGGRNLGPLLKRLLGQNLGLRRIGRPRLRRGQLDCQCIRPGTLVVGATLGRLGGYLHMRQLVGELLLLQGESAFQRLGPHDERALGHPTRRPRPELILGRHRECEVVCGAGGFGAIPAEEIGDSAVHIVRYAIALQRQPEQRVVCGQSALEVLGALVAGPVPPQVERLKRRVMLQRFGQNHHARRGEPVVAQVEMGEGAVGRFERCVERTSTCVVRADCVPFERQ
mmetsp:Transcript_22239/g.71872  ORF Transcript_22239/g.71872 Transcript_22239/m.71872 type:complete len:239 (-) Transcript_22239:237-953(-)